MRTRTSDLQVVYAWRSTAELPAGYLQLFELTLTIRELDAVLPHATGGAAEVINDPAHPPCPMLRAVGVDSLPGDPDLSPDWKLRE